LKRDFFLLHNVGIGGKKLQEKKRFQFNEESDQ